MAAPNANATNLQNLAEFPSRKTFEDFPLVPRHLYEEARKARRAKKEAIRNNIRAKRADNWNSDNDTKKRVRKAAWAVSHAENKVHDREMEYGSVAMDATLEKELELCYLKLEAQQARAAEEQHREKIEALSQWPLVLPEVDVFKRYAINGQMRMAKRKLEKVRFAADIAAEAYQIAAYEFHSALEPNGPKCFLTLPPEVRSKIYRYAMTDVDGLRCWAVRKPPGSVQTTPFVFRGKYNRGLVQTCRQVRTEAIHETLAYNPIRFQSWKQAMLVIRRYGLHQQGRPCSIWVKEKLEVIRPECLWEFIDSDAETEVESEYEFENDFDHAAQFQPVVEFCQEYPHINVQLQICNICPWHLLRGVESRPLKDGWFLFLLDWRRRHPTSSLKLTLQPQARVWYLHGLKSRYPEAERKLRVFGEEAMAPEWKDVAGGED